MYRKIIILLVISLLYTYFVPLTYADANDKVEQLEDLSKLLYENAKLKEYAKAKQIIEEISLLLPSIDFTSLTSVEGMEAITSTVINTKKSLAAIKPNHDTIIQNSTQLYLAVDALIHKEQPLWHRYYFVLSQDIDKINKSLDEGNLTKSQLEIQNFQLHYMIIKPAIYVTKQPYLIEKIDSLIIALNNQTVNQNKKNILQELNITVHELFYGQEQATWNSGINDKILWETSFGMGLIIFVVLSYVIWRKSHSTNYKDKK